MADLPPFNKDGLRVVAYYVGRDVPDWRIDVKRGGQQFGVSVVGDRFWDDVALAAALRVLNAEVSKRFGMKEVSIKSVRNLASAHARETFLELPNG